MEQQQHDTPAEPSLVLFSKDNVSVHPMQSTSQGRITGRLRLEKQGPDVFLTWIPYAHPENPEERTRPSLDRHLYSIRAVALSEIRSIRRHTPPFGWQYVIIVLNTGLAFPPLYFHDGGVRDFLSTAKQHILLLRSSSDPNVYLVNDKHDPLQRSLASLNISGVTRFTSSFPSSSSVSSAAALSPRTSTASSSAQEARPLPASADVALSASAKATQEPEKNSKLPDSSTTTSSSSNNGNETVVDVDEQKQQTLKEQQKHEEEQQHSSAQLQEGSAAPGVVILGGQKFEGPTAEQDKEDEKGSGLASASASYAAPKLPVQDMPLQVLERFSRVTRFAREVFHGAIAAASTSSNGFGGDRSEGFGSEYYRGERLLGAGEAGMEERLPCSGGGEGDSTEAPGTGGFSGGVPNEKRSGSAVGRNDSWGSGGKQISSLSASESSVLNSKASGGGEVARKLLHASESNAQDVHEESSDVGLFGILDPTQEQDQPPSLVSARPRPPPLGLDEWRTFLDASGRVTDPSALLERVFCGGLQQESRYEVWPFVLGFFPFSSTAEERDEIRRKKTEEYESIKAQWESISEQQARRFAKFRERRSRVEKDVVRTDRAHPFFEGDDNPHVESLRRILITYSFYNFDLGYCQGMSDLLSPILFTMNGNEADAFWCFDALMDRMGPNFHRDQNGMHTQLLSLSNLVRLLDPPLFEYLGSIDALNFFFCFRWVLIQFKREFSYSEVLRLWEVLWTQHLTPHFHLFICVAILKRNRRRIMDEQMEFDVLLKFINELSGHIDLDSTLRDAEALCVMAGERGAACIAPMPEEAPEVVEEPYT